MRISPAAFRADAGIDLCNLLPSEAAQQSWSHLPDVLVSPGNNCPAKSRTSCFYPLPPSDPSRIHFLCLWWKLSYSSFHITFPTLSSKLVSHQNLFFFFPLNYSHQQEKQRDSNGHWGRGASLGGVWGSWAQWCHRPLLPANEPPA